MTVITARNHTYIHTQKNVSMTDIEYHIPTYNIAGNFIYNITYKTIYTITYRRDVNGIIKNYLKMPGSRGRIGPGGVKGQRACEEPKGKTHPGRN